MTDHLNIADEYLQAYAVDALTFWPSLYDEAQDALLRMDVLEQPVLCAGRSRRRSSISGRSSTRCTGCSSA